MTTTQSPSPAPVGQGLTDEPNFLLSTFDAKVWADEFCKLNTAADHGTMLGWFACAIMTGFDEATRRMQDSKAQDGLVMPSPVMPSTFVNCTMTNQSPGVLVQAHQTASTSGHDATGAALPELRNITEVTRLSDMSVKVSFCSTRSCSFFINYLEEAHSASPVATARAARQGWTGLNDVQWMNIVNHEHAYDQFSKEDAVHEAVKRTEAKLKEINDTGLINIGSMMYQGRTVADWAITAKSQTLAPSGHDATGAALPQGWRMRKDPDGVIVVQHDKIGGYVASHNSDNIASTILYHLADELLAAAAPSEADKLDAALDVLAERQRQIHVEGWTPEGDDRYFDGDMARAAAAYAISSIPGEGKAEGISLWPARWSTAFHKPTDSRRSLVKAGALIIAEIERIDRAAIAAEPAQPAEKP